MHSSLRFTTSDLEGLPNIDGTRYEIIDGDLYVARSPDWHHQYVCGQVFLALQVWSHQTAAGVALPPLGSSSLRTITWSRTSSGSAERGSHTSGMTVVISRAAPDLGVEVLSPGAENEHRDRELKLYSRHGVLEYWIIDWQLHTIQVHRREHAILTVIQTLSQTDVLTYRCSQVSPARS